MHLFTYQTIKRIQEDKVRRSLGSYQTRNRDHVDIGADLIEPDAVVIDLVPAEQTEASRLIGA